MIVTIFGSNEVTEEEFEFAYEISLDIAKSTMTLRNGGCNGVMEATAKGFKERGAKVEGIVLDEWSKDVNAYNDKVIECTTIEERIGIMLENTDLVLIFDGSIGTLEELFVSWRYTSQKRLAPIVIVGEKMKNIVNCLNKEGLLREEYIEYIKFYEGGLL